MSKVKAGQAYVEIGGDPRKLFATLGKVQRQIGAMGTAFSAAGRQMMAVGAGLAAPFGIAAAAGSRFQDVILAVKASTGATAAELEQVKSAAMAMSQSLGVGPTEAAAGFLELLKAGMSLEQVLGGAGKAAIAFAKVGGMEVADASVVMADAMNVFKVTADTAANTLSAAADASSTSIEGIAMAFSQVSAVAGLANQSIQDTATALAVLANAGVKGSDAGTSLKTMLLRLMAPADEAVGAMQQLGLSTQSFRNADGAMKPLVEIIGTLTTAMQGMDQAAKDDIFRRIFGQDAIRAAAVLTAAGVDGFQAMQDGMGGAMTVGDKFATMSSGLSGAVSTLRAAMERLAISVSDAVGPAIMSMAQSIGPVIDGMTKFVSANKDLVGHIFKGIGVFTAAGAGLLVFGGSLSLVSGTLGKLAAIASTALAPLRLMMSIATGIGGAFASAVPGVFKLAGSFGQAIVAGLAFAGSAATGAASYVSSLAIMAGATAARMGFVAATWVATGIAIAAGFLAHLKAMITYYTGALAGMQAVTIARTGAMAAAWVASLGGVDTFGNALKSTLSMSNRVVASTVATIGPALGFISKGFVALASDVGRLAAPLTQPFVRAGGAVATFASGVATSVASYIGSIASAAAATVTNNARIAAAWVGSALKAVSTFVGGVAGSVATYVGTLAASVAATVGAAAGIAGAWLTTAFPATAAFVSQAVARIGVYIASAAGALAASVSSAAGIAVAWVSSGMPGLAAFVGSAVAGIATYLGACAAAVAGSVASAAAVAAAWLAPAAPILAIGGVLAGAAVVAYKFGGQLKGALSGVGELAGQAGAAIGTAFSGVVQDATVVFGDLYKTGKETFNGIYAAIAEGDLSGAMDILWAGLQAGWLRGVEALMGAVDPWISMFQNAFTILGAEIYKVWDTIWVNVSNSFNTFGAYLKGAFDNVINGVMASWDTLEAGIRKSWNYVQSFFKRGFDLEKENNKVDSEMTARARQRELERPGVEGRTKKAAAENERALRDRDRRAKGVDANTDATIVGREAQNAANADARRAATQAAEDKLAGLTAGQAARRAAAEADRIVQEEQAKIGAAAAAKPAAVAQVQAAASTAAASQAEVAGTFSAQAIGGMGFGQTLQQKANELLGRIEQNTRQDPALAVQP